MEQDAEKEAREAQAFLDGLPPSPPPETTAATDAPPAPPLPPQQVLQRPPKMPSDYFASRDDRNGKVERLKCRAAYLE